MGSKQPKKHLSNADEVLSAVEEVREKFSGPAYACRDCNSPRYDSRAVLGGPVIRICSDCGSKAVSARNNSYQFIRAKAPTAQGAGRGPIHTPRGSSAPPSKEPKPTYRKKGK